MAGRVIASGLTADRTFAFPDANGTIVVTGSSPTFTAVLVGDGSASAPPFAFASQPTTGLFRANSASNPSAMDFCALGTFALRLQSDGIWLGLDTSTLYFGVSADLRITRDAANVGALKNGTNGQTWRVYGNATGPKYVALAHDGTNASILANNGNLYFGDSNSLSWKIASGSLLGYTSTSLLGYGTGAGGAVTQATSKSTGVTLNTVTGQVTMNNAALLAAAKVSFVVTDSAVAATDTIIVGIASGGTANAYRANVTATAAGSFTVTVENITAGSLSEAPVVNFAVIKGVAS